MCGSLRLEGNDKINVGGRVPANSLENPGTRESYTWNGFARTDGAASGKKTMAQQWDNKEWRTAVLKITGFTEKGTMIEARRIGVIINDKTSSMKVLTRPARTAYEQGIHHRWPSRLPAKLTATGYVEQLNQVTSGGYKLAS